MTMNCNGYNFLTLCNKQLMFWVCIVYWCSVIRCVNSNLECCLHLFIFICIQVIWNSTFLLSSDLSGFGNLQQVIIDVFSSPTEEVRSAASFALGVCYVASLLWHLNASGNICAGNLSKYIPFIMSEIQKNPRRQYLLLHSLKEVSCISVCLLMFVCVCACPCVVLLWFMPNECKCLICV